MLEDNTADMVELITADVTDGDLPNTPNSEVTLTISNDYGLFTVDGHTILTSSPLAGRTGEYCITINAQDGGTPQQTSVAMFIIEVVNTNSNPPMFNMPSELSFTESANEQYNFTIADGDDGMKALPCCQRYLEYLPTTLLSQWDLSLMNLYCKQPCHLIMKKEIVYR